MPMINYFAYIFIGLNLICYLEAMESAPAICNNREILHSVKAVRHRNRATPDPQENKIFNSQTFYHQSSHDFTWQCISVLGNTAFVGAMIGLQYLCSNTQSN